MFCLEALTEEKKCRDDTLESRRGESNKDSAVSYVSIKKLTHQAYE
jgi:hypothetical protein